MKTVSYSNDEVFVLNSVLEFAIDNLASCSFSNSFEGLARRVAKAQVEQLLKKTQAAKRTSEKPAKTK